MKVAIYDQTGKVAGELELNPMIFGVEVKDAVIHQAVVAQQANARVALGHTKTRGEVRGGGKKPWKQKGTGRARHGSIRSPIWRGGGITFGPLSNRNFSQKINRKVKRQAIRMALSDKVISKSMLAVSGFSTVEKKTKIVVGILKSLPLKRGKIMLALSKKEKDIGRLVANANGVYPVWAGSLNVVDLLKNVNLVTTVEGIKEMETIYGGKSGGLGKSIELGKSSKSND